jgi:hypothetical protein
LPGERLRLARAVGLGPLSEDIIVLDVVDASPPAMVPAEDPTTIRNIIITI